MNIEILLLKQKILELENSNSWRLTAPLRKIWSCIRKKNVKREVVSFKNNKQTVVIFLNSFNSTGAPIATLKLVEVFRNLVKSDNYDLVVIAKSDGSLRQKYDNLVEFTLISSDLHSQSIYDFLESLPIKKILFSTFESLDVLPWALKKGLSFDLWLHEFPEAFIEDPKSDFLVQLALENGRCVVGSKRLHEEYIKIYNTNPSELKVFINPSILPIKSKDYISEKKILILGSFILRKGADLLVQLARELYLDQFFEVPIYWIGDQPEVELLKAVQSDLNRLNLDRYVKLFDAVDSELLDGLLQEASCLVILSREDPLPNVAVEAFVRGVPIIYFSQSTSISELRPERDESLQLFEIEYLDFKSMSKAIRAVLKEQKPLVENLKYLSPQNTWGELIGDNYFQLSDDISNMKKTLPYTVILANYNKIELVENAVHTIFNQTIKPSEIILADNGSTDGSFEKALHLINKLNEFKIPIKVFRQERNTTSPFTNWIAGMSGATSDIIWILEADDMAFSNFAERHLANLKNPRVKISVSNFSNVDEKGKNLGQTSRDHMISLNSEAWSNDHERNVMSTGPGNILERNIFPNVSALMFKRDKKYLRLKELESYKLAGDYFFYSTYFEREARYCWTVDVLGRQTFSKKTQRAKFGSSNFTLKEVLRVKKELLQSNSVYQKNHLIWLSIVRTILDFHDTNEGFNHMEDEIRSFRREIPAKCALELQKTILVIEKEAKHKLYTLVKSINAHDKFLDFDTTVFVKDGKNFLITSIKSLPFESSYFFLSSDLIDEDFFNFLKKVFKTSIISTKADIYENFNDFLLDLDNRIITKNDVGMPFNNSSAAWRALQNSHFK